MHNCLSLGSLAPALCLDAVAVGSQKQQPDSSALKILYIVAVFIAATIVTRCVVLLRVAGMPRETSGTGAAADAVPYR